MDDGVIGGGVDVAHGEEILILPGGWADLDLDLGGFFLLDLSFAFSFRGLWRHEIKKRESRLPYLLKIF